MWSHGHRADRGEKRMNYIIMSVLIIGYIAWFFGSALLIVEGDDLKWQIAGLISVILAVAVLIWAYEKYNPNDQPCAISNHHTPRS